MSRAVLQPFRRLGGFFRDQDLARKLIWINALLVVVPLVVMVTLSFSSFQRTMEKNVGSYQLQALKQVTLNIDTYMNELNRLTLMPYQYSEIMTFLGTPRSTGQPLTLKEIEDLNNFVSKIFINGRVDILGVSLYGEEGASYVVLPESQYVTSYKLDESAEWLKKAKGQFGQPTFLPTHEVRSTSGTIYQVFSIARELRSFNSGKTTGYIVIDIDPAAVRSILSQVDAENMESLELRDQSGNPVIRKNGAGSGPQIGPLAGEGVRHVKDGGRDLLVAYYTSSVTGWTTVSAVPVGELMKDSLVVRNSILLIGALCIGLAMLISVFIAFRVTKPLRKLSRLMRKVEQGEIDVSFPVTGRDEVGRLGHAFNMMVSKLSELGYLLYETEIREKDAQIAALQSKINPHFLYNTLGAISMYAELEGNREIVKMTNNLSRLLRYSLSSRKETVTLRDELEHVKGYMTIQQMRYEDRLRFELDAEEDALDNAVIPLMIQPVVENAILHGLDKGIGEGSIRLTCRLREGMLVITVEDDGIGIPESQLVALRRRLETDVDLGGTSGNGLLNVHRRIVLHFGPQYGMRLESMPFRGLKVILTLPAVKAGAASPDAR